MAVIKMGNKTLFTQTGNDEPVINQNLDFGQVFQNAVYPSGHILQVLYAEFTGYQDIAQAELYPINNLSISITPSYTNSKFLLMSDITHSATYVSSFGFFKDNSAIGGNNNSNVSNSITTLYWGQSSGTSFCWTTHISYLDQATDLSTRTYKVAASSSWGASVNTLRINDRTTDMRSISSFVVMEIKQ